MTHIRGYFNSDAREKCAKSFNTHALFIVIVFFLFFCGILEILEKALRKLSIPKKVCRLSLLFGRAFSAVVVVVAFFAFGQRQNQI